MLAENYRFHTNENDLTIATKTDRLVMPDTEAQHEGYRPMELIETWNLPRPEGLLPHEIGYNPSGIGIETDADGNEHHVLFVRVEPNDLDHVGKTRAVAYELDIDSPFTPLKPYCTDQGSPIELPGEDPAMQRISVMQDGELVKKWWVSTVVARYDEGAPDGIDFNTCYWIVDSFQDITPDLPPTGIAARRMKDVRPAVAEGTEIIGLGRPQPASYYGTISGVRVPDIYHMTDTDGTIQQAPVLNPDLAPFTTPRRSAVKIGSNYTVRVNDTQTLIVGHSGRETGEDLSGRDYRVELFGLNRERLLLRHLGTLAIGTDFGQGDPKHDILDLTHVVFPGGFCQDESGNLRPLTTTDGSDYHLLTSGTRDAHISIGVVKCPEGYLPSAR
jgi:hypothetical protein